jgi:hypothetical protein
MLRVIVLNVVYDAMLNQVVLNIIMLTVIMRSGPLLGVVLSAIALNVI